MRGAVAVLPRRAQDLAPDREVLRWWTAAGTATLLTVAAAVIGATAATPDAAGYSLLRALMVGCPMAVGLHATRAREDARFGRLLIAAGVLAFVTTLADTDRTLPYSVGRIAGWGLTMMIAVLLLAYPSGRLHTRSDRLIAAALALNLAVFFLPTALLAHGYRVPSPWTSCVEGCPANAFALPDHQPSWVQGVFLIPGETLAFALLAAVSVRLYRRTRCARPALRRTLTPALGIGIAYALLLGSGVLARNAHADPGTLRVIAVLLALCVPALAIAFALGWLGTHLHTEAALRRLAQALQGRPDHRTLRAAMAEALEDPATELVYPAGLGLGLWVDGSGQAATLDDRSFYEVRDHGTPVAGILHDGSLDQRPGLLHAVAGMAAVALDNQRLTVQAEEATEELQHSRERIMVTADRERRKIERDLHDGAQQYLVALRIELGLLEDLAQREPERLAERVHGLEELTDDALLALRALAHGMYPPLLADRGLQEAVKIAVTRCHVPVELRTPGLDRYAPEVEGAVYFCILEALQNIDKHASAARHAIVEIEGGGRAVRFMVHDDGQGADPDALARGAGITNMRDRARALGGDLRISSSRGLGTTVRGRVPIGHAREY